MTPLRDRRIPLLPQEPPGQPGAPGMPGESGASAASGDSGDSGAPDLTAAPGIPGPVSADRGFSRRAALQGLAGSLGAALAVPALVNAEPHPVGAHVAQRAKAATSGKVPASKAAAAVFFDPHQLATLTIVADLIIPGAAASRSPQFIDESLAIERPEVQQRFIGALSAVDAAARDLHRQAFKDLPRPQQIALLEAATAASSAVTPNPGSGPTPAADPGDTRGAGAAAGQSTTPNTGPAAGTAAAATAAADPTDAAARAVALRDPVAHLKTWIAGAHYSSEAGMKELGWNGVMFFEKYPGCTHPEGHHQ